MVGAQAFTSNSMKASQPFETFSYLHRLLAFQQRQPPRSTPSKKLNSGLIVGFVRPKYLGGRLLNAARTFIKSFASYVDCTSRRNANCFMLVSMWKENRFGWPLSGNINIWFTVAIIGSCAIIALLAGYVQKARSLEKVSHRVEAVTSFGLE
jgi:hypothetical protein